MFSLMFTHTLGQNFSHLHVDSYCINTNCQLMNLELFKLKLGHINLKRGINAILSTVFFSKAGFREFNCLDMVILWLTIFSTVLFNQTGILD